MSLHLFIYLEMIAGSLGEVICMEPYKVFRQRATHRICIKVDLSEELPSCMHISVGDEIIEKEIYFLYLLDACF